MTVVFLLDTTWHLKGSVFVYPIVLFIISDLLLLLFQIGLVVFLTFQNGNVRSVFGCIFCGPRWSRHGGPHCGNATTWMEKLDQGIQFYTQWPIENLNSLGHKASIRSSRPFPVRLVVREVWNPWINTIYNALWWGILPRLVIFSSICNLCKSFFGDLQILSRDTFFEKISWILGLYELL